MMRESTAEIDAYLQSIGEPAPKGKEKTEKSREKIIHLLSEDGKLSAASLAEKLGISAKAVEKHLARLKADGIIERIGLPRVVIGVRSDILEFGEYGVIKAEQSLKALSPIDVTLLDISILTKEWQYSKAFSSIISTPSGITTSRILLSFTPKSVFPSSLKINISSIAPHLKTSSLQINLHILHLRKQGSYIGKELFSFVLGYA